VTSYKQHSYECQVSRLQRSVAYQLKDWTNDHWRNKLDRLEREDQCLWKMKKPEMRFSPKLLSLLWSLRKNSLYHAQKR